MEDEHQSVFTPKSVRWIIWLYGMKIPLYPDTGKQNNLRNGNKGKAADFPDEMKVKKR
jgi:hypothetical protein